MTGQTDEEAPAKIVICGAGIVGLVLALALKKHVGVTVELYEQASSFAEDVGAALGFYPNGMRVLRDIDPELLAAVRREGHPYLYRLWEKHDGTEIARAKEDLLAGGDKDLYSMGIKRWRLQDALYKAVINARIPIYFRKKTLNVEERNHGMIEVQFEDGTSRLTEVLFGVDGGNSIIRRTVVEPPVNLEYTGVTCLMGIAKCPMPEQGIHFPSSQTSKCHAVYFPVGETESCFQLHFPISKEESQQADWGTLNPAEHKVNFEGIAKTLEHDGWDQKFIDPLYNVEHAVRVGFALLESPLKKWAYGRNRRIVLVGDSAHPPVPYIGQGAQLGVEDAGTIALLLRDLCLDAEGNLDLGNFSKAMDIYERVRIPRSTKIQESSKWWGEMQMNRSNGTLGDVEDLVLQGEVMLHGTLPVMFTGATHNYADEVRAAMLLSEQETIEPYNGVPRSVGKVDHQEATDAYISIWGTMPVA